MLMPATVKKRLRFFIYIFGDGGFELFRMNGTSLYWYLHERDGFTWRYIRMPE